ncbi:MAG: ABC transporter ATP-binding protein [Anaerolineae bacterium]|nr:ABC transporter ATP-binding protein [Anaerolineae bacterium]
MELVLRGINKSFGSITALARLNLSLSAANSGVTAILGPNGSGKSTLLRLLATLIKPDIGWASFGAHAYHGDLTPLRRQIGYLPQDLDLPANMTAIKLLRYLASVRQIDAQCIPPLLRKLKLEQIASKPLDRLSGGELRLIGITQALLGEPPLLLLDEPFRGLDLPEQESVRQLLINAHKRSGQLTIFSTHVPTEVEQMAQTVIVLNDGSMIFHGAVESLRQLASGKVCELEVAAADLPSMLEHCTVSRLSQQQDRVVMRVVGSTPKGIKRQPVAPTLEDAYLLLRSS